MPNKSIIRKMSKAMYIWQYTAGKFGAVASIVTMATVISIKFHVSMWVVFGGVLALIIAVGIFFVKSGWIEEEMKFLFENKGKV